MKKYYVAALSALICTSAQAADLPSRAQPKPVFAAAPVPFWQGFYVGANLGYAWGQSKDQYVTPLFGKMELDGVLGGVQAGYNHQFGSFVLGLEADFSLAAMEGDTARSVSGPYGAYTVNGDGKMEAKLSNLGTVRVRAGYAIDNMLLFATGGWAFANQEITASGSGAVTGPSNYTVSQAGSSKHTLMGWTLGAGGEYAFTRNFSAKLEYLHVDLGKETFFPGTWAATKVSSKADIVRTGVNYRF